MIWRAPWLKGRTSMLMLAMWDVILVTSLYFCTYRIRLGTWDTLGNNVFFMPLGWIAGSYLFGRYSPNKAGTELRDVADIAKTASLGIGMSIILILHAWGAGIDDAGTRLRGFIIPLFSSICLLSSLSRSVIYKNRSGKLENLIVCTQSERAAVVLLNEFKREEYRCKFVEDANVRSSSTLGHEGSGQIVIGKNVEGSERSRINLLGLRMKGIRILRLIDWCERYLHQIPPELVSFEWLTIDEGFVIQPGRLGWRVKRMGDIIAATGLIIVTAPLQLIACLMIILEDGRPILYRQTRTGLCGKEIKIVKFRSMRVGSEKDGAVWSKRKDSRVTKVGSILRRFRIDELPQLVNVITGDLSLIGPRPERPEMEVDLRRILVNYDVRYWIKPGLTGWAQVSYPYGASIEDSHQKLGYDLFYVKNAGLLMDILIVIKTIKLVVLGKGSDAKDVLQVKHTEGHGME